jgi:hypothetical protein
MDTQSKADQLRRQVLELPKANDWRSRQRLKQTAAHLHRRAARQRPRPIYGDDLPF